jgi:WhiB family redox-sensing transcriptional regulator
MTLPFSLSLNAEPWRAQAACRDEDPELFYVERAEGRASHATDARRICARCPVWAQCLEAALVGCEGHGIWGGAGEAVRRTFGQARKVREHGPDIEAGCSCVWCVVGGRHLAHLDSLSGGERPAVLYLRLGNPTHGRRSTYARGCRCDGCVWSASVVAQMVAASGGDTAGAWEASTAEGLTGIDATRAADHAAVQWLARPESLLVPRVWAWVRSTLSQDAARRRHTWIRDDLIAVLAESGRVHPGECRNLSESVGMDPSASPLLTIAEVAERLHVSTRTVERLVTAGALTSFRVGGSRRFAPEAIDVYLASAASQSSAA